MKKLSKFIYFIFAFALIACMSIFNPAIDFASAEGSDPETKSISITNSKIADTIDAKDVSKGLIVPMPNVVGASASAKSYIVVTDRSGTKYTYDCKEGVTLKNNKVTEVQYFTKLDAYSEEIPAGASTKVEFVKVASIGKGTYTVQYKVEDGNKTFYSQAKTVQVKGTAYTWEFNAEGEKNIIPSITDANREYVLPLPKILNNVDETKSIVYSKDDVAGGYIKVTNSGDDVTADVIDIDAEGNVIFTPTLAEGETTDTYIIKYVSKVTAFADKTFTVKVDKNYKVEAELSATHNSINNYQVGAVLTFPSVNVTDKTHNKSNVEVNNVIVIKKDNKVYATLEKNQYTYTFTEAGAYDIQYFAEDVYGNSAETKVVTINVSDKKPYQVSYADTYATTEDNWEDDVNTDIAYMIPSEVGYGGFYVPAIYAKDYVDSYEDLSFSRKIVATDGSDLEFDIDTVEGNAAYEAPATGNRYNERILFKFPAQGETEEAKIQYIKDNYVGKTFKLVYTAKDSNAHNLSAKATEYTFKVSKFDALTNNIDKNLMINFPTINDEIDPDAELSFTTATAKEDPTDSSLVVDSRVQVRTFYYYGDKNTIQTELQDYIDDLSAQDDEYIEKYGYDFKTFLDGVKATYNIQELKSVDGKTSVKLGADYTNQSKVTVFAVAINDQGQFVIKAQEVAINNTKERVAPTIVGTVVDSYQQQLDDIATGLTAFNQNYEVKLPSVSFKDFKINGDDTSGIDHTSLKIDVKCYGDSLDQTVGVSIDEFIQNTAGECGVKLAKLTTTYAGTYYVVYTATDDAGNVATYVSTFDVAKTEKAYIDVENGSNISANVGDEVKLNISLAGSDEDIYKKQTITVSWGDNKPSGLGSLANSYTFDKAGTYVATINAVYTMNGVEYTDTPSVTVTITVTEPEMTWASDVDEVLSNRNANINEKIELPVMSATENGVEINATAKVTFIGDDDKEEEVELLLDETTFNNYYFVADKNGVYTVTYTATTAYNSESKSFTITCGDYYEPTINIANNKLDNSKITYNGKDISVNVSFVQKEDENDEKITGKYTLTVIAKDANGKELVNYDIDVDLKDTDAEEAIDYFNPKSWSFSLTGDNASKDSTNKWTIKGVGEYELTLTVKDENNNSATKSIKFKVVNKTEAKSIKDDVVGIVLIVVSVVLLGGVIAFFGLAGKRNKTRRKNSK